MEAHVKSVVEECTSGSDEERLTFPEVLAKLSGAGVEQYHADLRRAEKTYYLADGRSIVVATAPVRGEVAEAFSAAGVAAAVRASQTREILYREFCARIVAAGCTGYFVSLTGRRAVYLGRSADSHVEYFPPQS